MIEELLVFGDSNSYGCETVANGDFQNPKSPDLAYGKYIQKALNIKTYKNLAIPGASNIMILETLFSNLPYIANKENTLILIGWSETNRVMFNIQDQEYRISEYLMKKFLLHSRIKSQINHPDHQHVIDSLFNQPFMQDFIKGTMLYSFTSDYFSLNDNALRLCADSLLSKGGYKFLAFPTLGDAKHLRASSIKKLFSPNTIFNFDYRGFGKYGSSHQGGHLKTEAHEKVAEFLLKELKDRNIV